MKWLSEIHYELKREFNNAISQLKRAETWLAIGVIAAFCLLAYLVAQFAYRTDSVLLYLHRTIGYCRELTNGPIIFLFCGMIFFMLAAVVTFGELQRYFEFRARGAHFQAKQSLIYGLSWAGFALGLTIAALLFFNSYCR